MSIITISAALSASLFASQAMAGDQWNWNYSYIDDPNFPRDAIVGGAYSGGHGVANFICNALDFNGWRRPGKISLFGTWRKQCVIVQGGTAHPVREYHVLTPAWQQNS